MVLLGGAVMAGPKKLLRKANKSYELFAYADAAELYQKLYEKESSDQLALKIADCMYKMNRIPKALEWYEKVEDKDHMTHQHHLHYGDVLESMGQYEKAKKWYEVYKVEEAEERRAERKLYGITHLDEYYQDSARYKVIALPQINSEFSDFSPAFFEDVVVFASARPHEFGTHHTFKWDNSSFLDLYIAVPDSTGKTLGSARYFDGKLNTKFHEGPLAFDGTGDRVIFTRNNYFHGVKTKSEEKVLKLKLYYADRKVEKDGRHGWHNFEEFPYNNDEYSVGHPTVTKDFNLLVFASEQPGGFGGTDLYMSRFENGEWTQPKNLGKGINTEGNEMFPFIHEDGTLYFASNGRDGLGGLDIYEATPVEESDSIDLGAKYEVKDFGYPVNSSLDDFGLIMNDSKTAGYFSSNRVGGVGSDDVYEFRISELPDVEVLGITFVKLVGAPDSTRELLPEAKVSIIEVESGEVIGTTLSDAKGEFSYSVQVGKEYLFIGEKDGLIQDSLTLDLRRDYDTEPKHVELILQDPLPPLVCFCVKVVDKDSTDFALTGATVYLMDEEGNITKHTTNADGKICEDLKPNTTYVAKSTKVKYLSDCFVFNTGDRSDKCKETALPLTMERLKIAQKFRYDKILFDLDKSNIRPDAAIELDKVVAFIKDHPGITVELGAHTDCRGSDAYNEALSERRAKSSREYIVSQGVDPNIITAKGYGENQLTNKCSNGVRCTEDEHQENRRTEIKITGIQELSVEEEMKLQDEIKGLEPGVDYSADCEEVKVIVTE